MKSTIIFILFLFFAPYLYSQSIKKYSGSYGTGSATYSYFESKDFDRIYHGSFSYVSIDEWEKGKEIRVNGSFENNLKQGKWEFYSTLDQNKFDDVIPKDVCISNKIIGTYKNGAKSGAWEITSSQTECKPINAKVTYNNDTLVGVYYFEIPGVRFEKGQFDSNGFKTGNWTCTDYIEKTETIEKYKDGFCYFLISRDVETGKIYVKQDYTTKLDSIFAYDTLTIENESVHLSVKPAYKVIYQNDKYYGHSFYERKYLARNSLVSNNDASYFNFYDVYWDKFIESRMSLVTIGDKSAEKVHVPAKILIKSALKSNKTEITKINEVENKYSLLIEDGQKYIQLGEFLKGIEKYKLAKEIKQNDWYLDKLMNEASVMLENEEKNKECEQLQNYINNTHSRIFESYTDSNPKHLDKLNALYYKYLIVYETKMPENINDRYDLLLNIKKVQKKVFNIYTCNPKELSKKADLIKEIEQKLKKVTDPVIISSIITNFSSNDIQLDL